jgi:hypothetical protein
LRGVRWNDGFGVLPEPTFEKGKTMTTWQRQAVAWLRGKAAEQAQNNERWPEHAKCYPTWTDYVKFAQRLADELEREAEEVTT